jgi:hypothetical protein
MLSSHMDVQESSQGQYSFQCWPQLNQRSHQMAGLVFIQNRWSNVSFYRELTGNLDLHSFVSRWRSVSDIDKSTAHNGGGLGSSVRNNIISPKSDLESS